MSRARRLLLGLGATGLVLVLVGLLAVWKLGPRYGIYLVPPSPTAYVEDALATMDARGYFTSDPEWPGTRKAALEQAKDAPDLAATHSALKAALKVAGGKHSGFFAPGESLAKEQPERDLPTVTTSGKVTTIALPKVTVDDPAFLATYAQQTADAIAAAAPQTCGWILDLRHNHGGNMWPMAAAVSALLPDGPGMGFVDRTGNRSVTAIKGREVLLGGNVQSKAAIKGKLDQPVAVLQDEETGSSAEAMALMFRPGERFRSFGTATAGYASANESVQLYDGASMLLTTAIDIDRSGQPYPDTIPPDEATAADQAPAAAAAWLATRCGG